jgi:hypothetical protein
MLVSARAGVWLYRKAMIASLGPPRTRHKGPQTSKFNGQPEDLLEQLY